MFVLRITRVTIYVRVFPAMSSFWPLSGRPAGFRKSAVCPIERIDKYRFVRIFGPIRKYIRTLPIAKAYDGMRQRKLDR